MYRYGSTARKLFKLRWKLSGLVQDHHIIPQQFRHNILVRDKIHESSNILMMPTPKGIQELRLRENRIVHWGPHAKYNVFVGYELDLCRNYKDIEELQNYLKWELRFRNNIPWK